MAISSNREKISLDGVWSFVFDQTGEGVDRGWFGANYPKNQAERMTVPGLWNLTHPGADGIGFYETQFNLPTNWQDKQVELVFEGVSYLAAVWVNGVYAGGHEGAFTPFRLDITAHLSWKEANQLVVRAASLSKDRPIDGIILKQAPAAKQAWTYTCGGIWGEVHLEALPKLAIQTIKVTPDLPGQKMVLDLQLQNTYPLSRQVELKLVVSIQAGQVVAEQPDSVCLPPGISQLHYSVPIPSPQRWTCQNPVLYRLRCEVSDPSAGSIDIQETRVGMREFTVKDGQFFLNDEPLFLRGTLLQPDYPAALISPPSKEMIERDIRLVKEAGFNLLRVHLRPAMPGLLDLTDELGVLVYAESCLGWIRESPRMMGHGLREVEALIDRDYNHPSVVFWGIYNENPPAAAFNGRELASYARSLDLSRVIIHNSGGSLAIDQDFGWIERTWVLPANETAHQRVMDIHLYLGCYLAKPTHEWLQSVGSKASSSQVLDHGGYGSKAVFEEFDREMASYRGKVFVSEIGCGAFNNMDQTAAGFRGKEDLVDAREVIDLRDQLYNGFEQRHLEPVFGSVQGLFEQSQAMQSQGIMRQVSSLLQNPQISGYIVTQFNDMAWELEAGIVDMWRNPKPAYEALKRLNQPFCLLTSPKEFSLFSGSSSQVDLTQINQRPLEGVEQIEVVIQDSSGAITSHLTIQPASSPGIHPLESIPFSAGDHPDCYHIRCRLKRGLAVLAEAEETIHCLPQINLEELKAESRVSIIREPAKLTGEEWSKVFEKANQGQPVIIGALRPEDKAAQEALLGSGIKVELHTGYGSWLGCHHWLPRTGLTANLPSAGGLAGEAYSGILPRYVLSELGGTVLAGSIRCSQDPFSSKKISWRSDIELVPFGKGKIIFCQYRIFEPSFPHPVATHLERNLIKLAA
jgi:beta-galactosidase